MKDVITVMGFTIKEMVRRKSFIVSTIIILILIVVGFNVPKILKAVKGEDSTEKIFIVDSNNIFEGKLGLLKQLGIEEEIEVGEGTYEDIKKKIEDDKIKSAIIIEPIDNKETTTAEVEPTDNKVTTTTEVEPTDNNITTTTEVEKAKENYKIRYIVKNKTMMEEVPNRIVSSINALYSNIQIQNLGLTQEQLNSLAPNFEFSLEQTEKDEAKGNVAVIMLMSMVLFYGIYFCAYQVSTSITTEKTSKIMETLVTSTSPKNIIWGKTLGIGVIGVVQMVLIVTTAFVSAKTCLDENLLNSVLDMSNITVTLGIITIIYFILGYLAYSLLYALTGSTVSKPEDVNSANTPVALLSMIGFYLSYFTMINPTSKLNMVASLLPISSPFCMPFRIMMGLASTTDVLVSIAILIVTIIVVAKVAIKIYSSAILNYGTKLSIKDVFNMYKDKNN